MMTSPSEIYQGNLEKAKAILKDEIIKYGLSPHSKTDLEYKKLLDARNNNLDFELELAKMICGDNTRFPYKRSSFITEFFEDLGLDYQHDGTTRRFWIEDVLEKMDVQQIHDLIKSGLFNKKYFKEYAKEKNVNVNELISNAKKEFTNFIQESTLKEDIDLSSLLDINISTDLLYNKFPESTDKELDDLVEEAKLNFQKGSSEYKQIALEKLWDAFERLKTCFDSNNKKKSVETLLDKISDEIEKSVFNIEFKQLTDIGNSYRIRHHEKGKNKISKIENINYLFFRMLNLIGLCLNKMPQNYTEEKSVELLI